MFIFIAETYNFVTLFYYHVSNKRIAECVPRVNEKLFEYSLPAFWVCSSKSIIILHVWLPCMRTSLPCNYWAKLFLKAAGFIPLYEFAHQACTKSVCINILKWQYELPSLIANWHFQLIWMLKNLLLLKSILLIHSALGYTPRNKNLVPHTTTVTKPLATFMIL